MNDIQLLLTRLIAEARATNPDHVPLIGVAGAQGSGKSFHCRAVAAAKPRVAHFSLDDVYFTRAEREHMARQVHPLFLTRGPPGTHDLGLACGLIARLRRPLEAPLPRFDKASDDRAPKSAWPTFVGPAEAILVDGWCLGANANGLDGEPLNDLEREDERGCWRGRVVRALREDYAPFFAAFEAIIYLKPPSWEIVQHWRAEQEVENLGRALTVDDRTRLDRFTQHYERITRSMAAGAHCANWVVELDTSRAALRTTRLR